MKIPPIRMRFANGQRGVALIECMIAILIFSFGVLGLVGLEARAITFSVDAEDRNRAAIYASEIASQMWLSGTVAPTTAAYNNLITNINNTAAGGLPSGTIAVNPVGVTTNAADIKITWQPPSDVASGHVSSYNTRVILP